MIGIMIMYLIICNIMKPEAEPIIPFGKLMVGMILFFVHMILYKIQMGAALQGRPQFLCLSIGNNRSSI